MEEKQALEEAYRSEKNAKVKIRILALLYLYVDGYSLEATAKLLRISIGSVQEYKRKYDQGKLGELRRISCSSGRPSALSESQQTELRDRVSSEHFLNSNAVCEYVRKKYTVSYTANAMTKLLKRLGFVHKKPKTAPGKATAAKQETFLTETLKPLLAEAGEDVPVYFEDAVHMQHNSQAAYGCVRRSFSEGGWILEGKSKELNQNSGRVRININGAVCFHNQQVVYREDAIINAESAIALLTAIRARHAPSIRIKVIMDNARYNYAKSVRSFAEENSIDLIFLPPLFPQLEPHRTIMGPIEAGGHP